MEAVVAKTDSRKMSQNKESLRSMHVPLLALRPCPGRPGNWFLIQEFLRTFHGLAHYRER